MTTGERILQNSSLSSGTASLLLTHPSGNGETIYFPADVIKVNLKNDSYIAQLMDHTMSVELNDNSLEANLQEDIFQAILYDDREVNFEN